MRAVVFSIMLCLCASAASAQEQERKLMDRVLKPDMTLQNSAQNKQFAVSSGAAPTRRVRPKMFQFLQRSSAGEYPGVREVETKKFKARNSPDQNRAANVVTRDVAENGRTHSTAIYTDTRAASDASKSVDGSEFKDRQREFLGRGKSQKALSAQDRPLTIDEVRELLNKNK